MKTFHLQQRDLRLLHDLGQVVLMTIAMIHARYFPKDHTGKACLRRLRILRSHGLIAPISFPIVSYGDRPGHLLALYRLTSHGAEMLEQCTGSPPQRLLRTNPRAHTLLHRTALAGVVLAVNDAAAAASLPEPAWILEQDMRSGLSPTASRIERFILYEDFPGPDDQVLACRPDASTWLRFPRGTPGLTPAWHDLLIWWEIDRSTETLTGFMQKVAPYGRLLADEELGERGQPRKVYHRHWPAVERPTLRVFTVCQSAARIQMLAAAIKDLPGAEFFRFVVSCDLTAKRFLADAIWSDIAGKRHAIRPS